MAGAPTILAQAVPCLLNAFPGWKQPVHCRVNATIGASGAVTSVTTGASRTTVELGITIVGADSGIYEISHPACRDSDAIHIDVWPDVVGTVTEGRKVNIDQDNTVATAGTIRFNCAKFDGTENDAVSPVSGSQIRADFWLDLG
jgi:hypothetical protein